MPDNARIARVLIPKPSVREHLETDASVNKGKKSRNGCLTCKAKRMKCDETKPTCRHCSRRGITCGGYAKAGLKWKHFIDPETGSRSQKNAYHLQSIPQSSGKPQAFQKKNHHDDESSTVLDCINVALNSITKNDTSSATSTQVNLPLDNQELEWPIGANFDTSFFGTIHPSDGIDLVDDDDVTRILTAEIPLLDDHTQHSWFDTSTFEISSFDHKSDATGLTVDIFSPPRDSLPFYQQPQSEIGQIDIITTLFNRKTCGVLSVKDSCDENPWRTLILPLAKNNPALSHAIAAMTCLHSARLRPELHSQGLMHLRQSIQSLREGLDKNDIRIDAALATTLALSLARSWEAPRIRTDFSHLSEAKVLLKQAVMGIQNSQISPKRARRLKFLANTWLYIDVTARLTASETIDSIDTELIAACNMLEDDSQQTKLDPLMGCASDLFPLLGRAADLVRQIWKDGSKRNSAPTIAQAAEVMRSVETWTARINLASSDDPAYIVQDAEQTAEAYRWAIFLLLRSAIPALPGYMSYEQLAQKILVYLATVPVSSGTVIVHMFPLLIAGCEVSPAEDRAWVKERWEQMSTIMTSGITERCLELTLEAWRRKDGLDENRHCDIDSSINTEVPSGQSTPRVMTNVDDLFDEVVDVTGKLTETDTNLPLVDEEAAANSNATKGQVSHTSLDKAGDSWAPNAVRSRLSWLAVMHDWKWQVMLG